MSINKFELSLSTDPDYIKKTMDKSVISHVVLEVNGRSVYRVSATLPHRNLAVTHDICLSTTSSTDLGVKVDEALMQAVKSLEESLRAVTRQELEQCQKQITLLLKENNKCYDGVI